MSSFRPDRHGAGSELVRKPVWKGLSGVLSEMDKNIWSLQQTVNNGLQYLIGSRFIWYLFFIICVISTVENTKKKNLFVVCTASYRTVGKGCTLIPFIDNLKWHKMKFFLFETLFAFTLQHIKILFSTVWYTQCSHWKPTHTALGLPPPLGWHTNIPQCLSIESAHLLAQYGQQ